LRMEDNQPDPYLLFTVKDKSGSVVRNIKTTPKKGLKRIVWDFRYNTPAPVTGRNIPASDELFSGTEEGSLVAPGDYTVTLSKYEDGVLTELTSPVAFTCKLLENNSLPVDIGANVAFWQKVTDLRKAVSAATDLMSNMDQRTKNANIAIQDMPAPAKALLEKAYGIQKELVQLNLKLNGDITKAKREFEVEPSINDRVSTIEGAVWNSTDQIPKTYTDSYIVASKQFTALLADMRKMNASLEQLEKELEMNNAPYTPGRWPEWSGN